MTRRMYIILHLTQGLSGPVARTLRHQPGVMMADALGGTHGNGVVVVLETTERERLAEVVMPIIATVSDIIEDLRLLPVRNTPLLTARA